MSAVVIETFTPTDFSALQDIFFESSTKKLFVNQEEKDLFQYKYLGSYLERSPELVLVAKKDGLVLGYLCGSTQTDFILQPHMRVFEDLLEKFPAHLHINCHTESRGLGIGTMLIHAFEKKLQALNSSGLHIMTGPDARNRSFYQKLGFNFEEERLFQERPILIMGKTLTALVNHI